MLGFVLIDITNILTPMGRKSNWRGRKNIRSVTKTAEAKILALSAEFS
jgi:hypothetical protein